MLITRTPLRISFFGGGTDYPDFYNKHGGEVLVSSIDKFSYIYLLKLSNIYDFNIRASYSKIEKVNHVNELEHPSMRACLNFMNIKNNIDISYIGDLPAKSGLGASSSFTVGLLHALNSFQDKKFDNYYYGKEAIHVEQNIIKEHVGSQDQMSTAVGGLNHIIFNKDDIQVIPLNIEEKNLRKLNQNLVLFYYGNARYSNDILDEQISNTKNGINDETLLEMKGNVKTSIDLLKKDKLDDFGELMNYNWNLKKKLSTKISTDEIDTLYDLAIKNGALGGKLLGAGNGGFLLFYIPNKLDVNKIQNLIKLPKIDFSFEKDGTSLIYKN